MNRRLRRSFGEQQKANAEIGVIRQRLESLISAQLNQQMVGGGASGLMLDYGRHLVEQSRTILESYDLAVLMLERRLQQSRLRMREFADELMECMRS